MKKISSRLNLSRRGLLTGVPALAAFAFLSPRARAALSAADSAELSRIQTYLNGIRTLQSRFEQISGDGGVATGTIYLSRPGKMRVEYDPPVPILLVATDERIWYYDKKLEQVSFFALKDTPAWFLLQNNVSFGGDIAVSQLRKDPGVVRVTVSETKNPDLGQATLVLSDRPLELKQWHLVDAQRKTVTVTLDDPRYGVSLNPSLFYWTDPRPPEARNPG
ncbi:MAG TPA: outer membrane lipoprotein carrier protein LolA [Stellaceae bacterium]|nr:outer membrane lipoprotein carrier protein LolA [Stellaceae bacterium]